MAESILSAEYFHNEEAAYEFVEGKLWPAGEQVCPHCGAVCQHYKLKGKSTRPGVYKCKDCRKPFTVKVGTIFESSHIPLRLWLQAIYLIASSKKGISANQLHRTLGITLKSAWFMGHRIREAMRELNPDIMGGSGSTAEMDETFVGGKEKNKHASKRDGSKRGGSGKEAVFSLVERGGKVRSHHVPVVNSDTLAPILKAQIAADTFVVTDDNRTSRRTAKVAGFKTDSVNHSIGEYVRGEVHTNTIEGYFSILKRGITGTYHHVSAEHLKRYLGEFDFRYNERKALGVDDKQRAELLLKGVVGKRLTYATPARGSA
ncbi:IS1595 family transposase [Sinimarinibacterium flocculans]|uniref:IS1595 family transposase n=1 Tax=Sinimarinibacterium flocculans TaxID=985250 RepID=UPI003517957B